ncbi:hypothetical protein BVJ63_18380 [Vibrio cholerae]|nr:hypothetical protein [Vibrio cholerae]MBO1397898.1 hypothetical protein [Vibrio cholerae]RZP85476.1 hypothetical protein D8T56_21995 [Vibrio vulnificus]
MNRLLCLSFNDLRFTKTKINSALIHKQNPRTKKTEMTHRFEIQTLRLWLLMFKNLRPISD